MIIVRIQAKRSEDPTDIAFSNFSVGITKNRSFILPLFQQTALSQNLRLAKNIVI